MKVADRAVCARCGAVLARDHAGEALCSPCASAVPAEDLRILEPEELAFAVIGLLLLHRGLRPARHVAVRRGLERLGVDAQTWEIHHAVEKARCLGIAVEARERQCGYRAVGFWRTPLGKRGQRCHPHRSEQLDFMDRFYLPLTSL